MIDPKELEQRVKAAVAGAGLRWEPLGAHVQVMMVEVANELLRRPLRELEEARKALGEVSELSVAVTRDYHAAQEAAKRYKASTQALLGQLSEASILSSEMMAIIQSPPFALVAPRVEWWIPLRAKAKAWLDKTQRVIGASPVRGG